MIRKHKRSAEPQDGSQPKGRRGRRRARDPLDVQLTVRFKFGAEAEDQVTVINNRSVPMVGSVIANRDRILKGFVNLLIRTALKQPRVARELAPRIGVEELLEVASRLFPLLALERVVAEGQELLVSLAGAGENLRALAAAARNREERRGQHQRGRAGPECDRGIASQRSSPEMPA